MKNPFVQLQKRIQLGNFPRSNQWGKVRAVHLKRESYCKFCGGVSNLEVHHVLPFHLDPSKELDDSNLITLCEAMFHQCHLKQGHFGNWHKFNPNIRQVAVITKGS